MSTADMAALTQLLLAGSGANNPDTGTPPTASFDSGTVAALIDATHITVDLGDKIVTVFVPPSLAGLVAVGSGVRIQTQENTFVLDSVTQQPAGGPVPVGALIDWVGSTVPAGWLKCDGSGYDTATYPLLFAILGSSTLPDFRDRAAVGASGTKAVKSTGGAAVVNQTASQMATHNHNLVHTHPTGYTMASPGIREGTGAFVSVAVDAAGGTNTGGASTAITSNNGNGSDMSVQNPYYAVHKLIKAG